MEFLLQGFDVLRHGYAGYIKLCSSLGETSVTYHAGEPDKGWEQVGIYLHIEKNNLLLMKL